jgi:hypothetical protein
MIPIPYSDRPQRRGLLNRPRAVAKTSPAFAAHNLSADLRSPRLAQPEEPMAVPIRAGHSFGDLRQAAEVLAVPGEAFFQDHDALECDFSPNRMQIYSGRHCFHGKLPR